MMRIKKKKLILFGVFAVLLVVVVRQYPRLNIVSGYAAKNMCSCMFEAGRSARSVMEEDNNFSPVDIAKYEIDTVQKTVTASAYGLMKRTAVYTEDIGCRLLVSGVKLPENPRFPVPHNCPMPAPYPEGKLEPEAVNIPGWDKTVMEEALDAAFAPELKTRAVVVLYKDQLVGEKYAPSFDQYTRILGWSMSKSVLATLYGIMSREGIIDIEDTHLFPEWENDDRKNISIGDLLQMQSGLEWEENYSEISDVTRMLFLEADMSKTQRDKKLIVPPGTRWNYSSGTTNLLSGYMRNAIGDYQKYLDFPVKRLFDRLGIISGMTDMDLAGNYVFSSYTWMRARDWAKLGLLYLHRGNWYGEQIIDSTWVDYVRTPCGHSNAKYGAHFWLNRDRHLPSLPEDTYAMEGYQGQKVYIIPSRDVVIVRMGLREDIDFDAMMGRILAALPLE